MGKFVPSKYQQKIFDFVEHDKGNLIIDAKAGSGKTSTIIKSLDLIKPNEKALFVAFNKSIVDELKGRITHRNVDISTLHSLGYKFIREHVRLNLNNHPIQIDANKYRRYIRDNINMFRSGVTLNSKVELETYINNLNELVDFARFYLCKTSKELEDIATKHSIVIMGNEHEVTFDILNWGLSNLEVIDFTDMVYIPNALNITSNKFKYDYVFVDECFPYNQRVVTEYGGTKIGELYDAFNNNKKLPLVKSFNVEVQKFEFKKITNAWKKGEREIVTIKLEDNYMELKCTPNELFLTVEFEDNEPIFIYKEATELNVNDIIVSSSMNEPFYQIMNDEQMDIIKMSLIGGGHTVTYGERNGKCTFTLDSDKKDYLNWKLDILNIKNVNTLNSYTKTFNSNLFLFTNDFNVKDIINNITLRQLAILYQDKTEHERQQRLHLIYNDYELIELLSKRLIEMGYDNTIETITPKYVTLLKQTIKPYYDISFTSNSEAKFYKDISQYLHKSFLNTKLGKKILEYDIKNVNTYVWSTPNKNLGGVRIDKVINDGEVEVVYDIEVEDNHNFLLPIVNPRIIAVNNETITADFAVNEVYDGIVVHNCQDLNSSQRELFLKTLKKDGRFVGVGDKRQAIYTFTGADEHSFDKLLEIPNTTKLPLSISYRCPKNVIELAKEIVPDIEAKEDAIDGEIINKVKIKDLKNDDMVLCRTTSPLFTLYMDLLKKGKTAHIKGKDIASNMIQLIQNTGQVALNANLESNGVFIQLYKDLIDRRNRLMVKKDLTEEEATTDASILNQYDTIKALEVLSKSLTTSFQLIERINTIFDDNKSGIILSTIHKSKGLEADNVYILLPSILPSPLAKLDWELLQEDNLKYVAYTRAKKKLGFIDEDEFSLENNFITPNKLVKILNLLYAKITYNLNNKNSKTKKVKTDKNTKIVKINKTKKQPRKVSNKTKTDNDHIDDNKRTISRLNKLIKGLTLNEAYDMFNDLGITSTIRVTKEDGKKIVGTQDLNLDRLNVEIKNKKINKILNFG